MKYEEIFPDWDERSPDEQRAIITATRARMEMLKALKELEEGDKCICYEPKPKMFKSPTYSQNKYIHELDKLEKARQEKEQAEAIERQYRQMERMKRRYDEMHDRLQEDVEEVMGTPEAKKSKKVKSRKKAKAKKLIDKQTINVDDVPDML